MHEISDQLFSTSSSNEGDKGQEQVLLQDEHRFVLVATSPGPGLFP